MGAGATADVAAGGDGGVGVDVLVREPDPMGVSECVFDDDCESDTLGSSFAGELERCLELPVDLCHPACFPPPFSFFPLIGFGYFFLCTTLALLPLPFSQISISAISPWHPFISIPYSTPSSSPPLTASLQIERTHGGFVGSYDLLCTDPLRGDNIRVSLIVPSQVVGYAAAAA